MTLLISVFDDIFQWTVVGLVGVHGVLVRLLVAMAVKNARAGAIIPCRNMVANFVMDPRENTTTAKKMTAQVI